MKSLRRNHYLVNLKDPKNAGPDQKKQLVAFEDANLVSSEVADRPGFHAPLLDIDFPAKLVPSTTEGHFHLYLEKTMTWDKYTLLLHTLYYCGIIERGYLDMSIARGASFARVPGVKKEPEDIGS